VASRLEQHMERNNLYDPHQSAYRKQHSTDTAMLKVHSDITSALDDGSKVALIMLDLSAAFDTIDHPILLRRLKEAFGIEGVALKGFLSYLRNCTQSVIINGKESTPRTLCCCVPQGSVLGPQCYCMYCRPLGRIAAKFGLKFHGYADDSQWYMIFRSVKEWSVTLQRMERCIKEVYLWMETNMLKMNEDKTDFIIFSPRTLPLDPTEMSLSVGQSEIALSPSVKNLGSWWDKHLNMNKHVAETC